MANREKVVEAFLHLLAQTSFQQIGLAALAARADMPLAELRGEFNSTLEVVAAFMRETDRKVLAGVDPDLADEPARERLFDVLMRRIETLKPHREAVRSLARSAGRDPGLALALNRLSLRSQKWMLAAAGIDSAGMQGDLRSQGLVVVMARTLRVWLDDEDPGLARTMATLDRELANGERMLNFLGDICRLVPRFRPGWRARRRPEGPADSAAA